MMEDPVETPSGHSFERYAIEKWLAEGNNGCSITKTPLKASGLRTNKTLRQSMEEWRDRNTMIFIGSMKSQILSNEEEEVIVSLGKLRVLCLERELHQEWLMMEDYLPVLVLLLSTKNFKVRSHVLVILRILATNNDDRKETIAKTHDGIKLILCSLARKIKESKLALQFLMELSENEVARNIIGSSQGCILLLIPYLVAMILKLPLTPKNSWIITLFFLKISCKWPELIILNLYFTFFLQSETVQREMAETLSEVDMTDHGKLTVCESGAVESLVAMLSHVNIEMKKAAILALEKRSGVPQNGLKMIKQGAVDLLFGILFHESLSMPIVVEKVVATIMNLALSLTSGELDQQEIPFLESEEDAF
ncbi:hypothetical protein Lser_V15G37337 [Lactuca serriola]